jgi:hypothetical protein
LGKGGRAAPRGPGGGEARPMLLFPLADAHPAQLQGRRRPATEQHTNTHTHTHKQTKTHKLTHELTIPPNLRLEAREVPERQELAVPREAHDLAGAAGVHQQKVVIWGFRGQGLGCLGAY